MNTDFPIRINKYLSSMGICSRRQADGLIEQGRVVIDGRIATMGESVNADSVVEIDGKPIGGEKPDDVILLFNKPAGIVCTSSKKEKSNIVDYINYPTRIYPVGRLDKDSRGLILLTNNGELANELLKARNYHEKEYVVRVNKTITSDFIRHMSGGVYLEELDVTTRHCKVRKLSEDTFSIVLTQGLNRQIRRMCEAFSYRVLDLNRVRIMNLLVDGIKEGEYRDITDREREELLCQITKKK